MTCRKLLLLYKPSDEHLLFFQSFSDWQVHHTTEAAAAQFHIKEAEVVLGNHQLTQSLPYATKLQWLQVASAGMDHIIRNLPACLQTIKISNARGVYDDEMAEHAIALLLSLFRELHLLRDRQKSTIWKRSEHLKTLANSSIMILGWGSLGKAISKRLSVFGCKLIVVSKTEPNTLPPNMQWVDSHNWQKNLSGIDALLITLPATTETQMMVNEDALSKISATAFVINIGRASVLDEQILYRMLLQKKIAGAALDVFNEEPLSKDHIAWKIPNLLISPHTSRSKEAPPYKYELLFQENFMRYNSGLPLLNQINIEAGY